MISSSLVLRPVLDRVFPKGFARSILRPSHTKEDTSVSNEHTFPLRDTPQGNTITTAFAATPTNTSSDAIAEGGVADGETWKYRKMDDEEAAGGLGEGWKRDRHNIRVEQQWEVQSIENPAKGVKG